MDELKAIKSEATCASLILRDNAKTFRADGSNPFFGSMDAFLFYVTISNKPIEEHIFRNGLHSSSFLLTRHLHFTIVSFHDN